MFNGEEFEEYTIEAKERWGHTSVYKEYEQKNKSKEQLEVIKNQLMELFAEIGGLKCLSVEDEAVQEKVKALQEFITVNFYNCTNEILKSLGQMYVNDERFKNNIDKMGGEGTAEFVNEAILFYCSK